MKYLLSERHASLLIVGVLVVFLTADRVEPGVLISPSGPGTIDQTLEGLIELGAADSGILVDGTVIEKTLSGLGDFGMLVSFSPADLDFTGFGNGFRWIERIVDDTGLAWTSYHITLSGTAGGRFLIFSDSTVFPNGEVPGLVDIFDFENPDVSVTIPRVDAVTILGDNS